MIDRVRFGLRRLVRRARRFERREVSELRAWLETTRNLVHLSILVFLPLLIGAVTYLANIVDALPFLLFPPLAAGTYTLFAHPESRYASPRRFVGGLTAGALCGWIALEATARYYYGIQPETFHVLPGAAAFGVFLTGVVTWGLDIEESSAFSTALLVLVTGVTQLLYVVSVVVSTSLIAIVFVFWRRGFYERRAEYLYRSTKGDDHVLVPMRGKDDEATAILAARLASAHEAGKVILLDVVDSGEATPEDAASDLEARGERIESAFGVPCEVLVAAHSDDPAGVVLSTADETDCDLIAAAYEPAGSQLSAFNRGLLDGDVDVVLHRSADGSTEWSRPLVTARRAGNVAHAMIDFACRLAPSSTVSVCHCIDAPRERRIAENILADLVETVNGEIETRVVNQRVEDFLMRAADTNDIVFLGASTDRSAASRFLARPTFHRLPELDCDVALVHLAQ